MNPVVVITAKKNSVRLPGKNMLPLGGKPLSFWSVDEARAANIETVVSTDIQPLAEYAMQRGCASVRQDTESGRSHAEIISDALELSGRSGRPSILLQPTSPFRFGGIVKRCWMRYVADGGSRTVVTTNSVHVAELSDGRVENRDRSMSLWDGNVAIFPPGRVCDFSDVVGVRNLPTNSLQIDTEEDYISACVTAEMIHPIRPPVESALAGTLAGILAQAGLTPGTRVTLVCREGGDVSQDRPACYVNHARGYSGGRCDVLFLIANPAIKAQGINEAMRECARRARVVLVRDNGELKWLAEHLPEIAGKAIPIRSLSARLDDHLTSGAIFASILSASGCIVDFIGGFSPAKIEEAILPFHRPAMSREIAILWSAGQYLQ